MKTLSGLSLFKIIPFVFILSLVFTGCAPAMSQPVESAAQEAVPPGAPMEAPRPMSTFVASEEEGMGNFQSPPADVERLVIKNGDLSIVVDDANASLDRISRMADELGGFVVSANLYQDVLESGQDVWRGSITIRVPAERLNDALEQIKAESDQDPVNETVTSQDVTSEYTDLESRLRNLEAAEEQLSSIMESAVKTEDVLNVYNQLVQKREQIEVIKGQMKYYEQSAAMSAISVELIPNEAVQPLSIGGWQPVGVMRDAVQLLIDALKTLANVLIYLTICGIPFFLIIVMPLLLAFRAARRRRAQPKVAASAE